jgi:hypothetical protein
MSTLDYQPDPFDIEVELAEALQDPEFRKTYDALEGEFTALDALLNARRKALAQGLDLDAEAVEDLETARTDRQAGNQDAFVDLDAL